MAFIPAVVPLHLSSMESSFMVTSPQSIGHLVPLFLTHFGFLEQVELHASPFRAPHSPFQLDRGGMAGDARKFCFSK